MDETKLFAIRMLIAIFVYFITVLPIIYFRTKKFLREGKSIKYLWLKVATMVGLPILSIPFLLSKSLTWSDKLIGIILAGMAGTLYVIGIDVIRDSVRRIFGLPPIDENTGKVIEEKDKEKKDEKED